MSPGRDGDVTRLPRGAGILAWRQVADAIEEDIRSGRVAAGAQLPTEAALATRYGVNRHTARRALAALAAKGLVRATRGSGTFVEGAALLYPIAARTRFSEIVQRGGREPGGRLLAASSVAADPAIAEALGLAAGVDVLRLETLRSADGVPISFATSHLPLPRFAELPTLLREDLILSAAFERLGAGQYRRRETRISARPVRAPETDRLELALGRVVLVVDSLNVDQAGAPIQATLSIFAADRVEIVVEEPEGDGPAAQTASSGR